MTYATASPAKLRSGEWGAKIQGKKVAIGDIVQIRTAAGKTWLAEVKKIVWSGDDATIIATESVDGRPTASTRAAAKRGPLSSGSFQSRSMRDAADGEKMIQRNGRDGYVVGETIHAAKIPGGGGPDGHYWTVVACGVHRISQYEDDCREGEWSSDAIVRAATDAEAQPVAERIAAADAAKTAKAAATVVLTTGTGIGRETPAGKYIGVIGREPSRPSSYASTDSIVEYESGIYHVSPVYDDNPRTTRLSASREEIVAAIVAAGWNGGAL